MKPFQKLNDILSLKLKESSMDFAVFDSKGIPLYNRFRDAGKKTEITELAQKAINILKNSLKPLGAKLPEHMILKGTEAFMIFIPSAISKHFYILFCDNGINSGMVRICAQDAVRDFEQSYLS